MGKIHAMMDVGKRSMMNSQTGLQTVAHNIANKSKEGYSRQRVDLVTNVPIQEGRLQIGTGAKAAQVSRINSPFVEKQLNKESSQASMLDSQAEALEKVEEVFNEQKNPGVNHYITAFFNSFRELSNNPESVTTRTMVKESAQNMIKDFQRVNEQLERVQQGIDQQVIAQVHEINQMTKEVATLNEKIAQVEIQGIPANDQRDQRDLLLKKLNEIVSISVAENERGAVTVSTGGNAILVSDFHSMDLSTNMDENNHVQVYYQATPSHPPFRVTDRLKGGSIGGAMGVRDGMIVDLKEKMDDLAYTIATEVNRVHLQGFDRNGRNASFFFDNILEGQGASKKISIHQNIVDDVNRIASAAKANAPGDNTVANVISSLQYKGLMGDGTSNLDDFYNSQVGRIGVIAGQAYKAKEAQDNVVSQITKLRESISGVSLDEEATKMIEYQKAFDASARLIRTADEMFETVLNMKRL